MSTGHDTKCPNCKGAGERLITIPMALPPETDGQDILAPTKRIVECALCTGTGLVEVDDYWEHG